MANEKTTGENTDSEITFICKFCGKSKPLSEMTLQKRFFPVLTACRECEAALQSLPSGEVDEAPDDTEKAEKSEGDN